jgi:transposase-like protein
MECRQMARKSKKTKEQIMEILAEMKAGAKLSDLLAKHGVSASTLYNWKSRFGGNDGDAPRRRGRPPKSAAKAPARKIAKPAARRPRAEAAAPAQPSEMERLKVMLVDLMLERDALKARLARR